ncbi:MAG: hypothetical protein LBI03_01410 [Clostridiales bacterium]|jgi:hypothetical protein|nr:hypothetical protein [Clostridiales bacterium]
MVKPIKKPDQQPESYRPVEKPEIIKLSKDRTSKVIKKENLTYIDGVPPMKSGEWGKWLSCTYSGCMTLLLNALGVRITYEQIMGFTGSCYRTSMAYGWDPGSNILDITYAYLGPCSMENVNHLCGMSSKPIEVDKTTIEERASLAAFKISLEACLEMFAPNEKFGYGAYDMMIKSFMDNKFVSDWHGDGDIYTIFITLTDARRAAYIYLEEMANLLQGESKNDLLTVSVLYKNMFDIFYGLVNDYDFGEPLKRLETHSFLTDSEEIRINIAEKLRRCKKLEYKAHDIIKRILENWEDAE